MSQTVLTFSPPGSERRRHPRTPVSVPVRCVFLDPDGPQTLDCLDSLDLSRSGVGALSSNRYYPGQRVLVSMMPEEGERPRSMHATVARCRRGDEGRYEVGLSFDAGTIATCADVPMSIAA